MNYKYIIRKLLIFVHSNSNIVGCLFGIAGLFLFFQDIIYENWFLIVVGLYAIGYRITPKPPNLIFHDNSILSPSDLLLSLENLVHTLHNRIPESMLAKVYEIKQSLDSIIRRYSNIKHNTESVHLINQTVTDYLPRILDTYMNIPPVYAKLYKMRNGMTATDLAMAQLDLLLSEINEISVFISKRNIVDLENHHRFLQSKFSCGVEDWCV